MTQKTLHLSICIITIPFLARQSLRDSIIIRPMQISDLEQVKAIDKVSFSLPWPDSAYKFELNENPLSMLWVAEMNEPGNQNLVVGAIVIWLILDEAHIATISVRPEYRGKGIAQSLLATAIRACIQKEIFRATLEVRANNLPARRLYQRFGFEIVGQRPRYYKDNGEDALIMTNSSLNQEYLEWLDSKAWQKGSVG